LRLFCVGSLTCVSASAAGLGCSPTLWSRLGDCSQSGVVLFCIFGVACNEVKHLDRAMLVMAYLELVRIPLTWHGLI
jgi:hypothetical protein